MTQKLKTGLCILLMFAVLFNLMACQIAGGSKDNQTETGEAAAQTETAETAVQTDTDEAAAQTEADEEQAAGQEEYGNMEQGTDITTKQLVAEMTLEQKIGQMIMPAFRKRTIGKDTAADAENVTVLSAEEKQLISDCGFGGVILFAENFDNTEQVVRLVADMQTASLAGEKLPLLIATDQEGGRVARLTMGTAMTGNMPLGAIGSADEERGKAAAYQTGELFGEELAALGINVNFAPVMDVNANPQNPVIGVRSYSDSPELVKTLGISMIQGIQSKNVATAVKHFPGHGDTATDSHFGLPIVDKSIEELRQCEFIPFQAAIEAGTDIVMTAHIEYPRVETTEYISELTGEQVKLPATLSKTIITDILRKDMGFQGVVATDAMNMDAIAQNFTSLEAVKLAINADVDILLMPVDTSTKQGMEELRQLIPSIAEMVNNGEIEEQTITDSAERIVELKRKRGILGEEQYNNGVTEQKIQTAEEIVGSVAHHEIERTIAEQAVTVVRNEEELLPLTIKAADKVLILAPFEDELNGFLYGCKRLREEGTLKAEVTGLVYHTTQQAGSAATTGSKAGSNRDMAETHDSAVAEGESTLKEEMKDADYILLGSNISSGSQMNPIDESGGWRSQEVDEILEYAAELGKKVVIISTGLPYDAARHTDAEAFVVCYCPRGIKEADEAGNPIGLAGAMIPASMDIIFGKCEATGSLPVNIMSLDDNYHITDRILYQRGSSVN